MIYIAQFFNMAFPKAGANLYGLPLTLALFFFGIALIGILWKERDALHEVPRVFWIFYILFVLSMLVSSIVHMSMQPSLGQLAAVAVLTGSPLAIILGVRAQRLELVFKITAIALLIVGLYAISQWMFGLLPTTIKGLNLTWGESWGNKPLFYINKGVRLLVKVPSTYQNGNLVGSFYTLAIPLTLAWRACTNLDKGLRYLAIVAGLVGMGLCGSRAALFPFILVWTAICIWYLWLKRRSALKELVALALSVALLFSVMAWIKPQQAPHKLMFVRYVTTTIKDPTATGRTTQIGKATNAVVKQNSAIKTAIFLVGASWGKNTRTEGILSVFFRYGLPAMLFLLLLLFYSLYMATRQKGLLLVIALGLLGGFGQFLGDSNFYQPPTFINWFFLVGICFNKNIAAQFPDDG